MALQGSMKLSNLEKDILLVRGGAKTSYQIQQCLQLQESQGEGEKLAVSTWRQQRVWCLSRASSEKEHPVFLEGKG